MKSLFTLIAIFGFAWVSAQELEDTESGNVEIMADPRLDRLIDRRADFYSIDSSVAGFRIQIYSTTERQDVMLAKDKFEFAFPKVPIYMKYDSPNFKLRVGDFESKLEAQYWYHHLRKDYPTLFLVPDKVYP